MAPNSGHVLGGKGFSWTASNRDLIGIAQEMRKRGDETRGFGYFFRSDKFGVLQTRST
jgi:hypothetical protein